MFELGNSLREARLRQRLDFPQLEQETKIRSKYLRALEEEQFELLPAQTYVKGFLRSYAETLGLDGQLYVDEYNSRYVPGEDEPPLRSRRIAPEPRSRRLESRMLVVALSAIGIVTALALAAWKFGPPDERERVIGNAGRQAGVPTDTRQTEKPRRPRATSAAAHVVVKAERGATSLEVRAGSPTGKQLFRGTLEVGRSMRFDGKRLWLTIDRPGNLVLRLNGRVRPVGGGDKPRTLVATAKGLRPASAA